VEDFTAVATRRRGQEIQDRPAAQAEPLQWQHNATPPALHRQLVRDPAIWPDFVATMPLDALTSLRDRLRAAAVALFTPHNVKALLALECGGPDLDH